MTSRTLYTTAPFLTRSPLTPNMSDIRSESGSSPSPKLDPTDPTSSTSTATATSSALNHTSIIRDAQLMTPPISPAKVGDVVLLSRSGDDSLARYLSKPGVDGPLFPEDASPANPATDPVPTTATRTIVVELVQGRGVKRRLVEIPASADPAEEAEYTAKHGYNTVGGQWLVTKFALPSDARRYLEAEKARLGRMKVFRPRPTTEAPRVDPPSFSGARRTDKRGASGTIKRSRAAPYTVTRSPRTRAPVDFSTSTRTTSGPLDTPAFAEARPIKPRPRPAAKPVDPNAPPKVSKGQRTDAEFEEALAATSSPILYPPSDNLDRMGPHAMKVEWKSSKKAYGPQEYTRFQNLKDIKFHPREIDLAGTINMVHLAQYEESKRLIFAFWYERKSKGLSFTKTHAQQAAHVDVNKASALWTAFEKVGWFSDEAFRLVSQKKKSWFA